MALCVYLELVELKLALYWVMCIIYEVLELKLGLYLLGLHCCI
jgi:hypothetical protein